MDELKQAAFKAFAALAANDEDIRKRVRHFFFTNTLQKLDSVVHSSSCHPLHFVLKPFDLEEV